MSTSTKAVKSIVIIIMLSIVSKFLGFAREVLIANKFGSGPSTDSFFIALTATTLFTTFFIQAINTTMIPVLSEIEKKEGVESKTIHTNNLLNLLLVFSLLVVCIGWVIAPLIVRVLAHGFEGEQFYHTVFLVRIGLPVVILATIVGVYRGFLQSALMFAESAATQFPYNLVYIIFLLFLSSRFGINGLMVASVMAVGSQILIQIPSLRKLKYRYRLKFDIKDKYVKKMVGLVAPVMLSVSITDINKIVDRSIASTLIEGSVSALNYANRLKSLLQGVFITAITTVLFPLLSQKAEETDYIEFKKVLRYGINTIVLITLPSAIGIISLSMPIVQLSFERGEFDTVATNMTSGALIFYSVGLIGMGLKSFLHKAYYALQDTKTPLYNGFIAIGINIVLNFILVQFMYHQGLALATSISAIVSSILLIYGLKYKIGRLGTMKMIVCGCKSLFASLLMGLVINNVHQVLSIYFTGNMLLDLINLLISALIGVLLYTLLIFIMKVEELFWFVELIKKKINRGK